MFRKTGWTGWIQAAVSALAMYAIAVPIAWAGDGLQRLSACPAPAVRCLLCVNPALGETGTQSTQSEHGSTAGSSDTAEAVDFDPALREPEPGYAFNVRSSVQVSRQDLREAYLAGREAYTKKLQKYAKCSQRDAEKAIAAAHPGMKVRDVHLRNIRTSLVYVGVAEDDEDRYLVIVDAGNGKVLMDRQLSTHHERAFAEHES